jgi:putative flippase GtrA
MSTCVDCATLTVPTDWPVDWPDVSVPATPAGLVDPSPLPLAVAPPARRGWAERAVAFGRFVLVGGASTAFTSVLFVLLGAWMPATLANTVATIVTTVGSNQAHARWTFRSGRRGAAMHLRAGLSVALTYPLTTIALLVLESAHPGAGPALELVVLLGASAMAGLLRYLLLLVGVFPDSPASFRPATDVAIGQTR